MKKLLLSTLLVLLSFTLLVTNIAAAPEQGKGSISGTINYCDKGGVAGMQVFVPGKPYVVITGTDGHFILDNIPVGSYSLNFMLRGKILYFNKWAEVSAEKTTLLDLIDICSIENTETKNQFNNAADNASLNAMPSKPESAKPVILSEINCKEIKEGVIFLLNNAKGKCESGSIVIKSCNNGFTNCDKKTSNGCETDTNNDDENCGSCFNACSSTDSCNIGMC